MTRRADEVREELLGQVADLATERQRGAAGEEAAAWLRAYYATTAPEDIAGSDPLDLYGTALAHRELAHGRREGTAAVRVFAPRFEQHGFASRHAVVQIVDDDMPFVVDSVRVAISARGLGIHVLHHPVIERTVLVHVEIDHHGAADAGALAADLRSALADLRAAVDDWQVMLSDLGASTARLAEEGEGHVPGDELEEAVAFLGWLGQDNFTFLGARTYDLIDEGGEAGLVRIPGSGLGILRDADQIATDALTTKLAPEARRLALDPVPLTLTKANATSTIHRPSQLDYVGVKRFDSGGRVIGERRYLGLFTSRMYTAPPGSVPLLRRKAAKVLERAGFPHGSHDAKDLTAILDTYPRDELVQISVEDLYDTTIGILHLQERRRTRLFLRRDNFGRSWSALVFLPRDRYNTDTRIAVEHLLLDALGGVEASYEARVSESVLARLHYVIRGAATADAVDVDTIEARIASAVRDWSDDLHDHLIEERGEDVGVALAGRYGDGFAAGYRAENPARTAVADIGRLEAMGPEAIDAHLHRRLEAPADELRLRVFRTGPPLLISDLLPVLEHLGARVVDERPSTVTRRGQDGAGADEAHVYDIGLRLSVPVDVDDDGPRVVDTLHAVWSDRTQSDGFHRLVLSADLTWREVAVVRAYARYLRQAGVPFSQEYVESCVTAHPAIARRLVDLFCARFDPIGERASKDIEATALDQEVGALLDEVPSLDEDRVLRSMLTLVRATLRTNAYQPAADGSPKPYLAFKLDPGAIPDLPLPRPHREIYVHSPRVEGVHLRGAAVARGGLRWSDRREDYRTEVLGLMKAQMVKNAVIVPAGAKGGFVVKHPPAGGESLREEVETCYVTFVSGLLDLTDNLVEDEVTVPPSVVRHDGDDPYLVVAADKGTATFSDLANRVAGGYGFWLGDAFASGGSVGYDHKRMGITARGAWESVKRHFRELAIDVQRTPVTVVGIGDMSGDVFGNGMLLSEQLRLVGAFNHLHVFVDPDPNPAASFAERQRLFDLPRSTWDDYDRSILSAGAGIFPRSAKSVPLSDEIRALLELEIGALAPNELIRALLQAPVDLLWNGGIGTYVKASTETHMDVGDKASEPLRIDATELRCRVIGEGGNLGLTQRGRIQYARLGGRVNSDAIDNSAGVDCSDHEVNIKILLDTVVADGDLTVKQRNELLESMTGEVAELVLADNIRQNQALVNAVAQAPSLVDVHQRYLHHLEAWGQIDRVVENLPTDDELAERKAAGQGLTSPEFAVLLAYTKNLLAAELLASDLPNEPWCERVLLNYFPAPLRERYPAQITRHRLRGEIISTVLANDVVDHQGITSLYRLQDETGAGPADAARAVLVATELFDLRGFRTDVAALDHVIPSAVQTRMLLESRKLAERGARWLVRTKLSDPVGDTVDRYQASMATLIDVLPSLLVGGEKLAFDQLVASLVAEGVPADIAKRAGEFDELFAGLDCVDLSGELDEPVETVAAVRYQVEDRLGLRWLQDQIVVLPRDNRWQALARLSLREDLHAQLRRLTAAVLEATDPEHGATGRVSTWLATHEPQVGRLAHVLADIRATGTVDLATLSVGLREVAQMS